MAKKTFSTKKNLKSLLSKSEANLEESAGNDGSAGDGGKTSKLFKWKKKKKTEPEADKTEEKTVSQPEVDVSGTGLDKDGVNLPNGGDRKKLTIYGTAPRSKKGLLSSSETDLRKPKKFGTFSFSWKKKSKQHSATPSHNATGSDAPQGLEEDKNNDVQEYPVDLTFDPGQATERRVRFELSNPEPLGPQVTPSPPPDQLMLHEVITGSPDAPDTRMAQELAPSSCESMCLDGEEGPEVQVDGTDKPTPLPIVYGGAVGSTASAALAALTRAASLRSGLPTTPPASPPHPPPAVAATPDNIFPLPGTHLPHVDTSLLKNVISETASAISEPVTANTDLSVPKTEPSDIPIPNSDPVAVVKETDTSCPDSDLSETIGAITKTTPLKADLADAVTIPDADAFVPKTEVYETTIPGADPSIPNTDISGFTVPSTATSSAKVPLPKTSLEFTDLSDALSHDVDSIFPKTEISNTKAPDHGIPNTNTSFTNTFSPNTEVPDTEVPGPDISIRNTDTVALNTDTSLPNSTDFSGTTTAETDVSGDVFPDTGTSLKNADLSDTISPIIDSSLPIVTDTRSPSANTSFPSTDLSDTFGLITDTPLPKSDLSVTFDSSLPKNEVSNITAPETDITDHHSPNTDTSSASVPLPKTSLPYTDLFDALSRDIDSILPRTEMSTTEALNPGIPNTNISDSIAPSTDTSIPNTDITDSTAPYTDTDISSKIDVPHGDVPGTDISLKNPDLSIVPSMDTSSAKSHLQNTSLPYTDLCDSLSHDIDSILSKTEISSTKALDCHIPNTDLPDSTALSTDLSDSTAPNPDTSVPNTDLSDYTDPSDVVSDSTFPKTDTIPNTDLSDSIAPNNDTSILHTDPSDSIAPNTDTSILNTDLSDSTAPYTAASDSTAPDPDLSDTAAPNTNTFIPKTELPGIAIPGTDISLKSTEVNSEVTDTVTAHKDTPLRTNTNSLYTNSSVLNTDLSDTAAQITDSSLLNTDLSNRVTPNTDDSPGRKDFSDTVEITNNVVPDINNSDPAFLKTDPSLASTNLSDFVVPKLDSSLPKTDLSEPFGTSSDAYLPPSTEVSYIISPNRDLSHPVIIKTALSVANPEDSLLISDASQTAKTDLTLPKPENLDTNGHVPTSNNESFDGDHTCNQCLHEADLKVDLKNPDLFVTEKLNPFCPSAGDLVHSRPDTPDQDGTIDVTVETADTVSHRQKAGLQQDETKRGLAAAEMGRLEGDGQDPWCDTEPIRRDTQERGAGDVMQVAPPFQEDSQEGQGKTGGLYQECRGGGLIEREELEQWGDKSRRLEEMEKKVTEKGAAGRLNLEEMTVEGQDGEEVTRALKDEKKGVRAVQTEDFELLEQKEWIKGEMEEVEMCSRLPDMEPDSPVQQECMPQKCEPAPPSPTTDGEGLPVNQRTAIEKHPRVLVSEEKTPERADCCATNLHNTEREHILTDIVTEGAHTLIDTLTERADSTHTSTLCDSPTGTEDPQQPLSPVTPSERTGRFLDDLSGPWGAVEESVSPGAQEDPDMMNSGYGILSTTLNLKPGLARDVKDDGRQRVHKVSLVSSYNDPGEDQSSSPAAQPSHNDHGPAGTEKHREFLTWEERSAPGEVPPPSLPQSGSESLYSTNSYYSPAFLDTQHLSSPGTNQESVRSTLSPEVPGSLHNSQSFSERSKVQWSWEREPGGWNGAERAAPAQERAREGGINSGSHSQWLSDHSFSSTQTEGPFSGVYTATRVDLLPSPTSADLSPAHDMDSLVDTLKSMDPPQRPRLARPPPLSAITSLPPIVEDSPGSTPKVQNGTSSLPLDLGLKRTSPLDMTTPLEMMKRQQEVDGQDPRLRSLPLRASADSSIVFRKTSPTSLSPEGSTSPQLNGSSSPGSSRLDSSLIFSSYRQENGKPQSSRPLTRAASLPDAVPSLDRVSSAPSQPGPGLDSAGPSRYERYSFLMSPAGSLAEATEFPRISLPPALSLCPLGDFTFSHSPSSPLDLLHSPTADPHSKMQRSQSVDSPLTKITPQPEPERPLSIKYRAFPDAYLTKEKEHGKLNPRPGKMLIFTEPGLGGDRTEIRSDVLDATSWDLPETIYIRVIRGGWVLYEKPDFKGEKIALDEGDIELTSIFGSPEEEQEKEGEEEVKSKPIRKCVIGSLRRAVRDYSVPEISLFPEENGEGKKVVFRDTSEDARIYGFPIRANSIIIKAGLWLVFAHPFMEGVPRVLEVGGYPTPASWGVTQPYVGSLHPLKIGEPRVEKPNEPKLVIFEKPYFTGKSRDVYTHLRDFMTRTDAKQSAFMGNAGSVKVVGGCWVGYSKENFRGHQYLLEEGDYHDWRVWGGCDSEMRSVRLIRADFSEPMLVMISRPDEEEEDQEQKTFEVTEAIPDVEPFNFPTTTHSIHVLNGAWVAYSHVDFSGDQYVLEKGFYSSPADWGATNNRICSIQPILLAPSETPTSRSQVLLYSEPDFQGQCQLCQENQECLPETFLTKSCRVLRGSWVLYEGREYSGNLYILPEGDYPSLNSMGCPPSSALRSLKIIPLMFAVPSISLYGLECFEGREVTLDSDTPSLVDDGFNNHVLSVRVNSGCWVVCEHINYRGRQILLEPIEVSNWLKFSGLPTIGSMYPVRQKRHFFRIKSQERGHFLSIQGGVEELKSGRVVVTEEVEGMSDIWYYQDGLIKNKLAPSMCLQVMGEVEPGAKVVLWSETRQPIQIWTTQASGIISSLTFPGMVLDIKGGKTYDRNHVIIYVVSEERPSQQWEIELL